MITMLVKLNIDSELNTFQRLDFEAPMPVFTTFTRRAHFILPFALPRILILAHLHLLLLNRTASSMLHH